MYHSRGALYVDETLLIFGIVVLQNELNRLGNSRLIDADERRLIEKLGRSSTNIRFIIRYIYIYFFFSPKSFDSQMELIEGSGVDADVLNGARLELGIVLSQQLLELLQFRLVFFVVRINGLLILKRSRI